jgi:hypothetical protein
MKGLLMARTAPSTGMSERDSSRALNFARGSFASFLAPSRKEEVSFFGEFVLGKDMQQLE